MPLSLLADSIKELNRITGRHKESAKNPTDIEMAKEVLEWHRRIYGKSPAKPNSLSDYQIYEYVLKPIFPNFTPEQLEIRVEVEGMRNRTLQVRRVARRPLLELRGGSGRRLLGA